MSRFKEYALDEDVEKIVDHYRQGIKLESGKMITRQRAINDIIRECAKDLKMPKSLATFSDVLARFSVMEQKVAVLFGDGR